MAGIVPPFTAESARKKVKAAQDAWNTKDPKVCSKAYTPDSIWRNRDTFIRGTAQIEAFLEKKWAKEADYRLRKEMFAFGPDRIAVQFWYEYRDATSPASAPIWRRCYGLEDWTFDAEGKMRKRQMSGNDVEIGEGERWFKDGVDVNTVAISEEHW